MTEDDFQKILKHGDLPAIADAAASILWAGADRPPDLRNFISAIMGRAFEDGRAAGGFRPAPEVRIYEEHKISRH